MTIEIGQVYKDAYPVNGRVRRFVVTSYERAIESVGKYGLVKTIEGVEVAVLEPRKRKPSKHIWLAAHRFNGPHARGLVRVK